MSPLFYEDSLGAKLTEKAVAAMDAAREWAAHPQAVNLATSDEAQKRSTMTASIVTWSQDMSSLGTATVAIGVFDGVHSGHQALLRDAVADAEARNIQAVAVTFDRDPDQVVSPSAAAPQLLTLADKLDCIAETGVDVILVVPFTPMLAEMAPESFVDSVLLAAMRPVAVYVGRDFRFGARATGDVSTLQRLGLNHNFEVWPHDLVTFEGTPVTSTRIRALIASGDMAAATALLCRRPRVTGRVHRGRGEGVKLGFPTANIVPVPYAALPANGVYAGRAILEDGVEWAAAISVGTPPTFPEARDYLEAHLIDFEGDLYDETITLEFFEKLRDQQAYSSLEELTDAIADDVAATLEIAGFEHEEGEDDAAEDEDEGGELVDDPAALAAAEAEVAGIDSNEQLDQIEGNWVPLLLDLEICEGPGATPIAFGITAPLEAAGIPFVWDPVTPGSIMFAARGPYPGRFALYVPEALLGEAQQAVRDAESPYTTDLAGCEAAESDAEGSEPGPISDPAALEAAEKAVREIGREPRRDPDDEMVVLIENLPYDKTRLLAIEAGLNAAGVEAVWNPCPPQNAPLLMLGILGENRFRVEVWNSQLELGRAVLQDLNS